MEIEVFLAKLILHFLVRLCKAVLPPDDIQPGKLVYLCLGSK